MVLKSVEKKAQTEETYHRNDVMVLCLISNCLLMQILIALLQWIFSVVVAGVNLWYHSDCLSETLVCIHRMDRFPLPKKPLPIVRLGLSYWTLVGSVQVPSIAFVFCSLLIVLLCGNAEMCSFNSFAVFTTFLLFLFYENLFSLRVAEKVVLSKGCKARNVEHSFTFKAAKREFLHKFYCSMNIFWFSFYFLTARTVLVERNYPFNIYLFIISRFILRIFLFSTYGTKHRPPFNAVFENWGFFLVLGISFLYLDYFALGDCFLLVSFHWPSRDFRFGADGQWSVVNVNGHSSHCRFWGRERACTCPTFIPRRSAKIHVLLLS